MKWMIKLSLIMLTLAIIGVLVLSNVFRTHGVIEESPVKLESEQRSLNEKVTKIVLSGPIDLVARADSEVMMDLQGRADLISRITTRVEGDTLYIGSSGLIVKLDHPLKVELSLPHLKQVQVLSNSDVSIEGFKGDELEIISQDRGGLMVDVDYKILRYISKANNDAKLNVAGAQLIDIKISGDGACIVEGKTQQLSVSIDGKGNFDSSSLFAQKASVNVKGSSNFEVFASEILNLQHDGTGDGVIYGNPAKKDIRRSGSGQVNFD
jgi:hypothetical protein